MHCKRQKARPDPKATTAQLLVCIVKGKKQDLTLKLLL
ncbi:hypothetical protein RNAN_3793 [Rheinheimera nanhaiensis E407-8]|uniref:Uncharacterized protein n=1 Tax=Rheinheimera nanhaiensis E407-8 TaxID=562729 RepID=I1E384_9GAMM|nr:hypothetical protein RNAN_3793 [Rheinheimera nanhaiensis E407-8]